MGRAILLRFETVCPVFQEVVSSIVCDWGGAAAVVKAGAEGSSMQVSKLAEVSVPRVELEPPVEDRISLDVMCSCNTCVIIGGGSSTIISSRAHCLSS